MWDSGYLLDLGPAIEQDAAWKGLLIADTLYTTGRSVWGLCGEFSPMPTIWNTRILEAAGVGDIPMTWDELLAACEKIKAAGKIPTSWGVGGSHIWHNIVASQKGGLEALAADQFDAPQILEAFKRMKLFVDNKWIPDNEIELTWQQSVALFVSETTAFYLNGAWTIGNEITSAGAAPDLKDNVQFAPFPAVGENGTTLELKKTTSIGVSKKTADDPAKRAAALTFLKFWFSPEGAKQWILLTKSPMGVKVDLAQVSGVDPLLMAFLDVQTQAKTVYGLPDTKAMQQRGWDDSWSGLQTLMAGKSADEALEAFLTEMSAYTG
jgi:ABC-type glycerol-3-phosphate transport system substrate-binding protein